MGGNALIRNLAYKSAGIFARAERESRRFRLRKFPRRIFRASLKNARGTRLQTSHEKWANGRKRTTRKSRWDGVIRCVCVCARVYRMSQRRESWEIANLGNVLRDEGNYVLRDCEHRNATIDKNITNECRSTDMCNFFLESSNRRHIHGGGGNYRHLEYIFERKENLTWTSADKEDENSWRLQNLSKAMIAATWVQSLSDKFVSNS